MTMLAVAFWTTPRNAADISFGGIGPPSTAVSRDAMMVELCARERWDGDGDGDGPAPNEDAHFGRERTTKV